MNQESKEAFWQTFLASRSDGEGEVALNSAWSFGDSPKMADELGALVASGIKTATCSALQAYSDDDPISEVGQLDIILNGEGQPICLIEITEVTVKAYEDVDASFAFDEGEGDRSLAYWREAHEHYFTRTLADSGQPFSGDTTLVCERFKVLRKA